MPASVQMRPLQCPNFQLAESNRPLTHPCNHFKFLPHVPIRLVGLTENRNYLKGVLAPSENSKSMSNSPSWYCAVNFLVTDVSATYPFSIALSGVIFSCNPETTRTSNRVMLTRSLPTRISFAPITRPVIGDST